MKKRKNKVATPRADGSVALKVCKEPSGNRKPVRASKMGVRRAVVLGLVHVLIVAHLVQWLISGRTLSPIEPSESMETLETGVINAGFVFFSLAILSTIVFGRFVCGWGCHIIALQDLCRWMMLKIGVRPKPFRSRLLMLVPLGLALYMFVWPNFKRFVVFPAFEALDVAAPVFLKPIAPLGGFETEFVVEDFWATFAAWPVAIPFLLVVGFASVYFLGAKGFCTYGCPYGGFFAPAEQLSPVRIRVTDACEGCGHCTASCSSNVRVHEEVRDFGMVVDPGCMKCLDCVSVCPNDALYVGLGRPAALAKPRDAAAAERWTMVRDRRRRMGDATWGEEVIVIVSFIVLFWSFRGMLGLVPMLMAVGIAGVGAFGVLMVLKLVREPHVRLHAVQLKNKGRVTLSGWAFGLVVAAFVGAGLWSGAVRWNRWQAEMLHAQVHVPTALLVAEDFQASGRDESRAHAALGAMARADGWSAGGFGWALTADELVRRAFLELVVGDRAAAEATLRRVIDEGNPTSALVFEIVSTLQARQASESEIAALLGEALTNHEHLHEVRREIALRAMASEGRPTAMAVLERAPDAVKEEGWYWVERARFHMMLGEADPAIAALREASDREGADATRGFLMEVAELRAALGVATAEELDALGAKGLHDPSLLVRRAMLEYQLNRGDVGRRLLSEAMEHKHVPAGVLTSGAQILSQLGELDAADAALRQAAQLVQRDAHQSMQMAGVILSYGQATGRTEMMDEGLALVNRAVDLAKDSPSLHAQRAIALANLGRFEEATEAMVQAARLGDRNAVLATRAADLLAYLGKTEEAEAWQTKARERAAAGARAAP
jgi:polyferredoxin/tetratricopeptide (TPR) repeat protein